MNIKFIKNTVTAFSASLILGYALVTTKDLLTRIVVIPFLIFSVCLLAKNICLIFGKEKIAKKLSMIQSAAFFLYYFGFLICWDCVAFKNRDFMSILFSLLPWIAGIFTAYQIYSRSKAR